MNIIQRIRRSNAYEFSTYCFCYAIVIATVTTATKPLLSLLPLLLLLPLLSKLSYYYAIDHIDVDN